jgi:putative transposase
MILIADRRSLAQDIEDFRPTGARLEQVCEVAGIDARTLQPTKHAFAPCPCWPMRACTWPVHPRLHGCYAHTGKRPTECAPRHPEPNAHPPPHCQCCVPSLVLGNDLSARNTVVGRWFHLYLILDLYSRKTVG